MDYKKEILDSIDILIDKKIKNLTKSYYGFIVSVNETKNTCVIRINGVEHTLPFYGGSPVVNRKAPVIVPMGNFSEAYVIGKTKNDKEPTFSVDGIQSINGNVALGAIRYSSSQSLSSTEQKTARDNIDIFNYVYPVGAIYLSVNSTNPATLFGFGTWEQIQDTFLLAAGSTYGAGTTGGEATHALSINEMPNHSHTVYGFQGQTTNGTRNYLKMQADGNLVVYTSSNQAKWSASSQQTSTPIDKKVWTAGVDGTTSSNGNGNAHNNMPPYLAVYVWKRTA